MPTDQHGEDQLCATCVQLDLEHDLHHFCLYRNSQLMKLGKLPDIMNNASCPLCRMISSCIASYGATIRSNSDLCIISRPYLSQGSREPANSDNTAQALAEVEKQENPTILLEDDNHVQVHDSVKWLEVRCCRHEIVTSDGRHLDLERPCEYMGIGTLLRTEPMCGRTRNEETSQEWRGQAVYARPVAPEVDVALIRSWITRCTTRHTGLCANMMSGPQARNTIKLIDVQLGRLVTADLSFKYVALSYVWGPGTKPLLTKSSIDKFHQDGSLTQDNVPLTIWDTMGLVRDLDERYLWVDSACIVQDDPLDKRQQLPFMGEIYHHATLVIVAAVQNAHSGLPGMGQWKRQWDRPVERIQGVTFTTGQPELQSKLATTNWNTRGWTYQESLLARRVLIFTERQVYWNCREELYYEDRFTEFSNFSHSPAADNSLFSLARDVGVTHMLGASGAWTRTSVCPIEEYCQKVEYFTARDFSKSGDIIWAFNGILKSLLPKLPNGFLWSMPKDCLDAALLWETDMSCKRCESLSLPTNHRDWEEIEVPSWSWIGKGHKVWYNHTCTVKSMVEWHEPVPYPVHDQACSNNTAATQMVLSVHPYATSSSTSDFARLHFTALSRALRLHTPIAFAEPRFTRCNMLSATVSQPRGKDIGTIRVPVWFFGDMEEVEGHFVLLSSKSSDYKCLKAPDSANVSEDRKTSVEYEEPQYNIMLIKWDTDHNVAYRVGWTSITKSAWEESEAQVERIVLG